MNECNCVCQEVNAKRRYLVCVQMHNGMIRKSAAIVGLIANAVTVQDSWFVHLLSLEAN